MRVRIAADACAEQIHWRFLDSIIGKVADGWHVWQIEDPDAIEQTGWLDGRPWLRELFQKAALVSTYPANPDFPQCNLLVGCAADSSALSPPQAAEYVNTPLTILMENRNTDGLFIDILLDLLALDAVNEQRKNAPDAIRYDSPGGGGQLPKLIADYAQRAENKNIPLRVVVFADSDGEIPGEIHNNARLIQNTCNEHRIPCCILSKRAIENYIPDEVLDAWIPLNPNYEKRHLVEAVKRLTSEQRDHYPMKKGLKLSQAKPPVQALYQGAGDADQVELAKGFGKNVIEKLGDFRGVLTPAALRRRDGRGELDRLAALIAANL